MTKEKEAVNILSDITVHMKYARYREDLKRRETWEEIVDRNKAMHIKKFPFLEEEIENAYKFVYDKKIVPSMRSAQFAGKPIEVNNSRVFNCSYLPINHPDAFSEAMFLLLGGTGVGFSVQKHHIDALPTIKKPILKKGRRKKYLIGDSIEGWADSVKMLIESYFYGKQEIDFDFRDIRLKGEKLITSGGKAPGPEPLRVALIKIKSVLENIIQERGEITKIKPIEAHDIVCHIADAVLAGGIRRAALISGFSPDDYEMLEAKTGNWWESNPQRGRANNSVVFYRPEVTKEQFDHFWEIVKASGAGEPGIYWTNDPKKDTFTNPCLTGDSIIRVKDENVVFSETEDVYGEGVSYDIPLKMLVDRVNSGEKVQALSYNEKTKELEWKVITAAALTRKMTDVIKIQLVNGEELKCTPDHKIFTDNRGWVEAKDLTEEDELVFSVERMEGNKNFKLGKIKKISVTENEDVYDLTVKDNHNFFANGVCVHNCAEISLSAFGFCNLTEINANDIENQEDLNNRARAAAFLGTLQASYTDFHYLRDIWRENAEKEALLGVSMTGIASGTTYDLNLTEATEIVNEENERVAALIGINKAQRTTCVKPSGTTSLVLGTSSGIHAWHSPYYIRRIRVGKNESIYQYLSVMHPEIVEDEFFRPETQAVISIPVAAPKGATTREESVFNLLERSKRWNVEWVKPGHREGLNSHNVSVTISVKENEWEEVGKWMWENRYDYNGISVLPYDGGTYKQAPFEEITEEEYNKLITNIFAIDLTKVIENEDNTDLTGELACAGSSCEVV